jgi:hypothetical protein
LSALISGEKLLPMSKLRPPVKVVSTHTVSSKHSKSRLGLTPKNASDIAIEAPPLCSFAVIIIIIIIII